MGHPRRNRLEREMTEIGAILEQIFIIDHKHEVVARDVAILPHAHLERDIDHSGESAKLL